MKNNKNAWINESDIDFANRSLKDSPYFRWIVLAAASCICIAIVGTFEWCTSWRNDIKNDIKKIWVFPEEYVQDSDVINIHNDDNKNLLPKIERSALSHTQQLKNMKKKIYRIKNISNIDSVLMEELIEEGEQEWMSRQQVEKILKMED